MIAQSSIKKKKLNPYNIDKHDDNYTRKRPNNSIPLTTL